MLPTPALSTAQFVPIMVGKGHSGSPCSSMCLSCAKRKGDLQCSAGRRARALGSAAISCPPHRHCGTLCRAAAFGAACMLKALLILPLCWCWVNCQAIVAGWCCRCITMLRPSRGGKDVSWSVGVEGAERGWCLTAAPCCCGAE